MSEGTGLPRLTLCADDYGWSPATSRTIAALIEGGKLNATGCMTVRPNWPDDSRQLRDLPAAQIGLHLVLTEEVPLTVAEPMPGIAALRGARVDTARVAAEIEAQFDAFEQAMGRPPAFVDGHQHAHALPGIRPIVLATTRCRAPGAVGGRGCSATSRRCWRRARRSPARAERSAVKRQQRSVDRTPLSLHHDGRRARDSGTTAA